MDVEFRLISQDGTNKVQYKKLFKTTLSDIPRAGSTVSFPKEGINTPLTVVAVHWDIYDDIGTCDVLVDVVYLGGGLL